MSEGVEWGLHGVLLLSMLPAGATLPGKAIAEFHGVSESYMLKHLKALVAAGVLVSVSGPRGGYRLARPATAITFLDVTRAIEGPEPAFRCTEIRRQGPVGAPPDMCRLPCAIRRTMHEAEDAWRAVLERRTIAEIGAELSEKFTPEHVEKTSNWLAGYLRH